MAIYILTSGNLGSTAPYMIGPNLTYAIFREKPLLGIVLNTKVSSVGLQFRTIHSQILGKIW